MLPSSQRKDYVGISFNKNVNYDNNKSFRRQSCWRNWNRLSSLQRSVLCMTLLFGTLAAIYFIPNIYHSYKSIEELDDLTRRAKFNGGVVVAPHVPADGLDPVPDIQKRAQELKKLLPQKRGPPALLDRVDANDGRIAFDRDSNNVKAPNGELNVQQEERMTFKGPTNERQEAVVAAFMHSWSAYKKYAWGHDHLKPVSKTYEEWFGTGLTLIDSLDTMYIMGLNDEFAEARSWVEKSLTFDVSRDVNLFECTIRVLGGLLSAYHLSGDKLFLDKAIDVADRLMPAFTTNSGVPYSDVNLRTGKAHAPRWGPDSSTAEVTTIQLEFRDLSHITGDDKYK